MTDGSDDVADPADVDGTETVGGTPDAEQTGTGRGDAAEANAGDSESEPEEGASDPPLADLARRLSDRRRGRETDAASASAAALDAEQAPERGDAPGGSDDPFREMSVAEVAEEELWSSLSADEAAVRVGASESASAATPADEGAEATPESDERVVSKGDYCQKCPHLHEPPELACTHEGTEIVAVEDAEHFRVRNCPMVDE